MKKIKTPLIVSGVILASLALFAFRYYIGRSHNIRIKTDEFIITTPTKTLSKKVVFLWGGINYATPEWMMSQIPDTLLNKYTFVILKYDTPIHKAYETYRVEFKKEPEAAKLMLIGFSAGAKIPQNNYSSIYHLIGLIAPSTTPYLASIDYGENTILTYNVNNWSSVYKSFDYKEAYEELEKNVLKGGGKAENIDLRHKEFVKYFFENYIK